MATNLAAAVTIKGDATLGPTTPHTGDGVVHSIGGTYRTRDGQGSGLADRVLLGTYTVGSGATTSFDLLAAGSLVDVYNQAIDLDEIKMLIIEITSGEAKFQAPASNGLSMFTTASQGIQFNHSSGLITAGFWFGAGGLDVTSNSKFDLVETSSSASAVVKVYAVGAN